MSLKWLPVGLLICYPVLVHASVMFAMPRLAFVALVMLVAAVFFRPLSAPKLWAWLLLIAVAVLLDLLMHTSGGLYAVYLPSLVMPAALFGVFAGSLRAGREPLIQGVARISRGGVLPDDLAHYTRRLTLIWALVFVAMFVAALGLIALGRIEAWSLLTNVLNYLLIALLVAGEHAYRRWRFPQHRHEGLIAHIRTVARSRRGRTGG